MRLRSISMSLVVLFCCLPAGATVFATVHGVVHDPAHRPVQGARITLRAADSDFRMQAVTDGEGSFALEQVPLGAYTLHLEAEGFRPAEQTVVAASGANPVVHLALQVAAAEQSVVVRGAGAAAEEITPTALIGRAEIDQTPGASRTLGLEMITSFVPGAYMTHDMLHIRGGHQTSWLIDGISIPNTKIGSNVGPQIDPKDIEQLETQRGAYQADVGDRTYGVFNVLPRNGFERNREGEWRLMAGNLYTAESQLSLGDHTDRTAWYASAAGSRSNYGLAPPVAALHHDATNSQSGFLSLISNQTARDQLRLNAQIRRDYFQVPYDPDKNDWQQASQYYESWGLRDRQTERDGFLLANWVRTLSPRSTVSFAPFYHLNQAEYDAPAADLPAATTWHQKSNYGGGQIDGRAEIGPQSLSAGVYAFYQAERDLYGVRVNDGSAASLPNSTATGGAALTEFYVEDHLRLGRYITLVGGERFSSYHAWLSETAIYPRIGATLRLPRLGWVLRGFYGHFFQPAPLVTVSQAVLNYAHGSAGENTFTALPSERDEEHQFGVQIPIKGWALDIANAKSRVNNFLDHSNLGESNMYFPIAVDGALVRSWELSLRSPVLARTGQFHLAYSNQIAEQRGNVIGGFTCTDPQDPACNLGPDYTEVDHDQRNTLSTGFTLISARLGWFSGNLSYGSGFTNGLAGQGIGPYNGDKLPEHGSIDLSAGRGLGERWRVAATVLNLTNHRVLLDNSVTIGGFHRNDPRMIQGEIRYRFRF